MFLRNLLIGITTIFAWVPATLLALLAALGLFAGIVNIFEMPFYFTLLWIGVCVGGLLGYVALTAVSFGLKLKFKLRLLFLLMGFLSLLYVCLEGSNFQGELIKLGTSWFEIYLVGGPLLFGLVHIVLHITYWRKAN